MKNKMNYLGAIALIVSAAGCGNDKNQYDASGTFEATEIIVSAEGNGKLMRFAVEEGDKLTAGQEVGYIDTVQLYLSKLQLAANANAVRSRRPDIAKQVAATREQIAATQREKRRTENLLKQNAATQKQLDDIDSQLAVYQRQLAAQLSTLENNSLGVTEESSGVEIQIAQTEDLLCKSHIASPATGTVLAKYAEQGEFTQQGKPLFKIADMDRVYLRAYVTSGQLSQLKLGQQVQVFSDYGADGQKQYPGTVTWIADQAEFTPKTIQTKDERANLVYAVKVAVKNDGLLKIGMYGEVKFTE